MEYQIFRGRVMFVTQKEQTHFLSFAPFVVMNEKGRTHQTNTGLDKSLSNLAVSHEGVL